MSIILPQSVDMTAAQCDDDFWRTATSTAQQMAQMASRVPQSGASAGGAWTACGDYLWLDNGLAQDPQPKT